MSEICEATARGAPATSEVAYRASKWTTNHNWLRARRHEHTDHPLSMSEAFERYGGEVVEDVLEKGSKNVAPMKL